MALLVNCIKHPKWCNLSRHRKWRKKINTPSQGNELVIWVKAARILASNIFFFLPPYICLSLPPCLLSIWDSVPWLGIELLPPALQLIRTPGPPGNGSLVLYEYCRHVYSFRLLCLPYCIYVFLTQDLVGSEYLSKFYFNLWPTQNIPDILSSPQKPKNILF